MYRIGCSPNGPPPRSPEGRQKQRHQRATDSGLSFEEIWGQALHEILYLPTAKPAAQNGSENSAINTPPPASAPTVQIATKAFQAMANAPVNKDSPAQRNTRARVD